MLKLGTIGTSWITEQFIDAAKSTQKYHLRGIYSRDANKAKSLAEKWKADFYCDSLQDLLYDPEIDVIYIASPNGLHFQQAMEAIRVGKHVIVEKPAFSNVEQWEKVFAYAQEQGVKVFEAVVHYHGRNYRKLKQIFQQLLKESHKPFLGANFNIGQYSSKYDQYLEAMEKNEDGPNVFNLQYAGGSLMDIGVYPIYIAIDLFGMPNAVAYHAVKGANGVDLFGNIVFIYGHSQVNIFISKGVHSILNNEIYLGDHTLVIKGITRIAQVDLINRQGDTATLIDYHPANIMFDEADQIAEVLLHLDLPLNQEKYELWKDTSYKVVKVMEDLRRSANIILN